MNDLAQDLAEALDPEQQVEVFWSHDPGAPPPGPGVVTLRWLDKTDYNAAEVEGPDWMEKRRARFSGSG